MNTLHGQPVEIGDEVYSITHGYGKVVKLYYEDNILVEFPLSTCSTLVAKIAFHQDGRSRLDDVSPILYWTKPKITGGTKKRTEVRRARFVVRNPEGLALTSRPMTKDEVYGWYPEGEILCEVPGTEVIEYI